LTAPFIERSEINILQNEFAEEQIHTPAEL